jgi:hypothetical protein
MGDRQRYRAGGENRAQDPNDKDKLSQSPQETGRSREHGQAAWAPKRS